jgi:IS5 family transposase
MEQERYKETGSGSFYGEYLYDQLVPEGHFLRKLKGVIDWGYFTKRLIQLYKGQGLVGRPPFDPALILKMEVIAYLYKLSERQVEVYVNENIPAKYFVGLAVDGKAPDHTTLSAFRERLLKNGKLQVFGEMLGNVVQEAMLRGVKFGSIQVIDSVHSIADVNTDRDQKRQGKGKGPHDPDAKWGVKHQRKVKTEQGEEKKQTEYFFGYKAHVSMNAESGLITNLEVSSGEEYDGHHFCSLVDRDLGQKLSVDTYAGDRGYDDGDNHYYLWMKGLHSAIRLKRNRTMKKDKNKEVWLTLEKTPEYIAGRKERYKIERKFGEAKQGHGFGRCRYIGKVRFAFQAYLTAIILNLKRMVKLLTGTNFKARAYANE